ncbi:MAG: hypothetical protein KAH25_02780 [Bacteroidales bacterium]|nr:hypothetical protein [Bacteroidales bacterium]
MKTQHIIYLFLVTLLIISGCREITVTTKVNKDGSFTRTIKVTGDSSSVFRTDLPYPVDGTWTKKAIKDTTDKGDYILTYTKTFKESDLLNDELSQDTSWRKHLKRKFNINKRFGFFYSYITFSETYKATKPFERLNYPNNLTPEEMHYLSENKIPLTASDSIKNKQVSDKFVELLIEAITNEIIITLEDGITKLNDPQLKPESVKVYRDSIEHKLEDYHENMNVYIDFFKDWTGNESVNKLKTIEPPIFEKLDILLNTILMDAYSQSVEMPGLITETNSISVTGNKVSWKVNGDKFIFQDYEMRVESRVVNKWPFIVTGLFIFLVLILLFIKVRKQSL